MNITTYNELIAELNEHDTSIGMNTITLNDTDTIKDILLEFNYMPIGLYETKNSIGYKFKDEHETYSLEYKDSKWCIYSLIDLT